MNTHQFNRYTESYEFADFFESCEQILNDIVKKLEEATIILRETNEECCKILCKTPEGHKINLEKARIHVRKIKEEAPKNPLDKILLRNKSLLQ